MKNFNFTVVLGDKMLDNFKHCSKREAKQCAKYLKQIYRCQDVWVINEYTRERVYTSQEHQKTSSFIANKFKNFLKGIQVDRRQ